MGVGGEGVHSTFFLSKSKAMKTTLGHDMGLWPWLVVSEWLTKCGIGCTQNSAFVLRRAAAINPICGRSRDRQPGRASKKREKLPPLAIRGLRFDTEGKLIRVLFGPGKESLITPSLVVFLKNCIVS